MGENKNIRVREILRRNFYRITELKNKGYSWREILIEIGITPSRELERKYCQMYPYIAKKITSNAKSFNRYKQGIKQYVKKNIEKIIALKASGFDWREIIEILRLRSRFPLSKDIRDAVRRSFYRVKGEIA